MTCLCVRWGVKPTHSLRGEKWQIKIKGKVSQGERRRRQREGTGRGGCSSTSLEKLRKKILHAFLGILFLNFSCVVTKYIFFNRLRFDLVVT